MEEFDDLIQRPDEEGCLDLAHRGWVNLDDAVWTMNLELRMLNVSFNNIKLFPARIGDLTLLKEIDCCCNKLISFPPEVGRLKRLTKLKCNGNLLVTLPEELSECKLLTEITASENKIKMLPPSLGDLPTLQVFRLQNNCLSTLPPEFGNLLTLEEIDVSGNSELEAMIPKQMSADTKMILWTCALHRDYQSRIAQLKSSNTSLEQQAHALHEINMALKDEIRKKEMEKQKIIQSMPTTYMAIKEKALKTKSQLCAIS